MTMSDTMYSENPDPHAQPEFYRDGNAKRLLAWVVDVLIIGTIALILSVFTFFTALLFFPLFYAAISFAYRWLTLTGGSATPGMRLMSLELRDAQGQRFDAGTAFLHTA